MNFPELYLSRPGVAFPGKRFGNQDIVDLVKQHYKGD